MMQEQNSPRLILVLDNVRSAYNVGSVFRTADCAGVSEVIICGYTPDATHPKVKKTALGAELAVPSRKFETLGECIDVLKSEGIAVYAFEAVEDSQDFWKAEFPREKSIGLIFGNEVVGVQLDVTRAQDVPTLAIPMFGGKSSLNIASAVAIASYDIAKRWQGK